MIDIKNLKPIPKYIIKKIKNKDKNYCGYTRYYSYFTKIKKELCLVTVGCKDYDKQWLCKQVIVHGIHSDECYIRDVEYSLFGYSTGWYERGLLKNKKAYNDNKWYTAEDKYYNITTCVVNKKYALNFKEYKYSMVDKYKYYDVFKYLKMYEQYPQAEYLMKLGLQQFATKKSILKQIGKDKNFRKWIIKNKELLINEYGKYPYFSAQTILNSYKKNSPLLERCKIEVKIKEILEDSSYKHIQDVIQKNEIETFIKYLDKQNTNISCYEDYIDACKFLNIDLNLKENKYPNNFQFWHDSRINEMDSKKAELDEEKRKELYKQFREVANKYSLLQRNLKENFMVIIPKSPKDLINEGKKLHHCVGRMGYDEKFAKEKSLIFFVRNVDNQNTPLVTLEYSLEKHKVLQCYADHDSKPSEEILNYVNKIWLPYANRKIKKVAV